MHTPGIVARYESLKIVKKSLNRFLCNRFASNFGIIHISPAGPLRVSFSFLVFIVYELV